MKMKTSKRKKCVKITAQPTAFTLVELMVCIALISILSVAVGLAVQGAYHRTGQAKTRFNQLQGSSHLIWTISQQIQLASHILFMDSGNITFVYHDISTGVPTTVNYSQNNQEIYRSVNGNPAEVYAPDIYQFVLSPDEVQKADANYYVRGNDLTIQVGPDASGTLHRYIALLNTPLKP